MSTPMWRQTEDAPGIPMPTSEDDVLILDCSRLAGVHAFVAYTASDGKWVNLDDKYPVEYGWEDANDYCIIQYRNPR